MRERSAETQLRQMKREHKAKIGQWEDRVRQLIIQRDEATKKSDEYRGRATRAEQDCVEWKLRFDALLERVRPVITGGPDGK